MHLCWEFVTFSLSSYYNTLTSINYHTRIVKDPLPPISKLSSRGLYFFAILSCPFNRAEFSQFLNSNFVSFWCHLLKKKSLFLWGTRLPAALMCVFQALLSEDSLPAVFKGDSVSLQGLWSSWGTTNGRYWEFALIIIFTARLLSHTISAFFRLCCLVPFMVKLNTVTIWSSWKAAKCLNDKVINTETARGFFPPLMYSPVGLRQSRQ